VARQALCQCRSGDGAGSGCGTPSRCGADQGGTRAAACHRRAAGAAIEGNLASTLEPGSHDAARVAQLRARLAVLDPEVLRGAAAESPGYDARLEAAVRRFQAEEGLEADGRIGACTRAALNAPVEAKIGQLRVALDMRRGLVPLPSDALR
jgi:murein L,D-transpeptidase YcbB/YkuD